MPASPPERCCVLPQPWHHAAAAWVSATAAVTPQGWPFQVAVHARSRGHPDQLPAHTMPAQLSAGGCVKKDEHVDLMCCRVQAFEAALAGLKSRSCCSQASARAQA